MRLAYYVIMLYLLWCAITGRSKLIEKLLRAPELAAMTPSQRTAYLQSIGEPKITLESLREQYVIGIIDIETFSRCVLEILRGENHAA